MKTGQAGMQQQTGYQGEFTRFYLEDVADGCLTIDELGEKAHQVDQLVAEQLLHPEDTYRVSLGEALGILTQNPS